MYLAYCVKMSHWHNYAVICFFQPQLFKKRAQDLQQAQPQPPRAQFGVPKNKMTVTSVAALGVCPIPFPAARFAQSGAGITISVRLENHPSRSCIWSWWQQHTRRSSRLTCEPCRRGLRFLKRLMLHLTIQVYEAASLSRLSFHFERE